MTHLLVRKLQIKPAMSDIKFYMNINFKIVADNKIYTVSSSNLYEISSKKDVHDAFQISKKEIGLHFRKNNIKFRKDSPIDIVSTIQHFIH